ncbi:methyltransferase domain-containing protein [candidate division KSB1 bacterium]|nr:methyltransferase domain-containing protein [candidate division KSB1 bacterium]
MDDLKTSIVRSLDGQNEALFPHLAYLLQDLWEIGASPGHFIQLICKNDLENKIAKAVDLGCGKGAVAIQLAKNFGWQVDGFDAMPAFIQEARQWSKKHGTENVCSFNVCDIRELVKTAGRYDLVILGSIGSVFGSIEETLRAIRPCLFQTGYVLLDDGYQKSETIHSLHQIPTRENAIQHIRKAGFVIIDEITYSPDFISASNQEIYSAIQHRVLELEKKYPETKQLFQNYLAIQRQENSALENDITCVTWLLKYSVDHD